MNKLIQWFEEFLAHFRHHSDPVNHPMPTTPLQPAPPEAAAIIETAHIVLPTGDAHGLEAPPSGGGGLSFLQRIMASGDARGANAGGSGGTPMADPQPEFRDGSTHRFEGPGEWPLVADRKCGVRFTGGESGGVPQQITVTVFKNGQAVASKTGESTHYEVPDEREPDVKLEAGDRVSLRVDGRSNLGLSARLSVKEA